jgi:hypothetical protein
LLKNKISDVVGRFDRRSSSQVKSEEKKNPAMPKTKNKNKTKRDHDLKSEEEKRPLLLPNLPEHHGQLS